MNGFLQDLRYSARILLKKPGFTSIAVMTLALGIGANTAIFSVVDAVLLRSLPYPEPDRLMQIFLNNPETAQGRGGYGNTDFLALKERNSSFEKVAAISPGNRFSLTGIGAPEQVIGAVVPPDFRFSATGPSELWTTLQINPPRFRPPYYLRVIGRLKPGTTEQEAQAE